MSDPVAEKSGFLKVYMSSHPDTLVAYAKWFGKVPDSISSAEMSAIDTKSMTLTYSVKGSGEKKVVRIPIEPPLAGYEDVKPRLLGMKAEAQEGLGMIKAAQITSFRYPAPASYTFIIYVFLAYITYGPTFSPSPVFDPARIIHSTIGGWGTIKATCQVFVVIHSLEATYTLSLCRKHRTPFSIGAVYVLSTLLCGMPIWADLRKRIQNARIESVMKVE